MRNLCVDWVCKRVGYGKVYRSVFTFGIETTTLDNEGEIVATSKVIPTREQIEKLLPEMIGDIEIEVPKYSAVHINGNRAYDLARKGIDFTPPKKVVNVERFELLACGGTKSGNDGMQKNDTKHLDLCRTQPLGKHEFYFEIQCQTGTYSRSLAKLMAQRLGTVAIASTIIRTRVGEFTIQNAKTIEEVTINDLETI